MNAKAQQHCITWWIEYTSLSTAGVTDNVNVDKYRPCAGSFVSL